MSILLVAEQANPSELETRSANYFLGPAMTSKSIFKRPLYQHYRQRAFTLAYQVDTQPYKFCHLIYHQKKEAPLEKLRDFRLIPVDSIELLELEPVESD